jgi:hypothetical protein
MVSQRFGLKHPQKLPPERVSVFCLHAGMRPVTPSDRRRQQKAKPLDTGGIEGFWGVNSLTMSYFHTGNPHYHRR